MKEMTFTSKKEYTKEIKNKYKFNQRINEQDSKFLYDLFSQYHPDWKEKTKDGISYWTTGLNKENFKTSVCFYIISEEGDKIDMGLGALKKQGSVDKLNCIKIACRLVIHPIICEYKFNNVEFGITKCTISGKILTEENCQIDHYDLNFDDLFSKWISKYSVDKIFATMNDGKFTDQRIINNFIEFHNSNTHLRAITNTVNMNRNKKSVKEFEDFLNS